MVVAGAEGHPNQAAVAPYLYHPTEPQSASNRKRRGQPHHAADDTNTQLVGLNLGQKHPSSLHEMLV